MKLLFSSAVLSLCIAVGCIPTGSTRLCDGFESYETVKEVRKKISDTGMSGRWQESSERTVKSDPRPAYKFLTLAGPFRLSGVEGHVKLTFYNDRLMSTEFSTESDRDTNLVDRDGRPPGPPLAVILDAVIFEDGELVGPDLTHTFDMVSTRVKAEQDIHQKLLRAGNTGADRAAVWDEIGRAAQKSRAYDDKVDPRYARMQRAHADELLRVRDAKGEAAAIELAKTSAKYPKIWRRQ